MMKFQSTYTSFIFTYTAFPSQVIDGSASCFVSCFFRSTTGTYLKCTPIFYLVGMLGFEPRFARSSVECITSYATCLCIWWTRWESNPFSPALYHLATGPLIFGGESRYRTGFFRSSGGRNDLIC